jgi:ABC-type Fe3+-siderophore transport system permease subunit
VSLLLFMMIVVPTMLAAFHVWRATQGLDAIKRIVRVETTPLGDIREGPVEVEGVLEALEPAIVAASGREAVFADVEVKATRGGGRNSVVVHQSHTHRSVATVIKASDGTTVKLDFEHLELAGGEGTFLVGGVPDLAEPTRAWATEVPNTATSIQFKERVLEPGARVIVSGIARVTDATVEARSTGYRDGATVEKKTFVIGGTPEARMLVAQGSERQLLWRATWPVAVLMLTAIAGLAYAGLLLALLLAA